MTISLSGQHTAPYGEFPYNKGEEFLKALQKEWPEIVYFSFDSIDGANVMLKTAPIMDWTLCQILDKLDKAVSQASKICDWNIWTVHH